MTLAALQHLIRATRVLAEDCSVLVFGSASLLASCPSLGEPGAPLATTYDADLCPEPFDELTGTMLEEALGEDGAYHRRHGYHADILRDSIFQTLPIGWRERLVPVPGSDRAQALEPHDLAAVKLLVARAKDLTLVRELMASGIIQPALLRERLDLLPLPVEALPRLHATFRGLLD